MALPVTIADAIDAGFVLALNADSDFNNIDILVKPTADLDGSFRAFVTDWNETVTIHGWLWTFESIAVEMGVAA